MPALPRDVRQEAPRALLWADDSSTAATLTQAARDELDVAGIAYEEVSVGDGPALELFFGKVDVIDLPGSGKHFFPGVEGVRHGIDIIRNYRDN